MIKLMIDGERVNLAADLSLEFYDMNPFFTSEGQHTLDIDISLADPQNARIYNNMHRIDVAKRPIGRSAVLYYEKRVIISGKEVVLEIDSRIVKIQIVAGNSEFNYIAGSDKRLRELDLGCIPDIDENTALNSLQGAYPQWDFVCAPVCAKVTFRSWLENVMYSGSSTYQKSTICNEIEAAKTAADLKFRKGTRFCAQPYLAAIVRRVLEALGYNLVNDYIGEHKELSRLIIVHSHDTLYYNMMVENWTVESFLSQVENLCAVCFVVDNLTKEVDILNAVDYYETAEVEAIDFDDVIGDINKQYDQEPPDNIVYHNIAYKFPDTNLYKFYSLDQELVRKILIEQVSPAPSYPAKWYPSALYDIFYSIIGNDGFISSQDTPQAVKDEYDKMVAYNMPLSLTMETFSDFPYVLAAAADSWATLKMINQFGPRIEEESDDNMELDIVPVEIVWCYRTGYSTAAGNYLVYPLPIAENSDTDEPSSSEDEKTGLITLLHDGETGEEAVKENLFVAFYIGVQPDVYGNGFVTPMSINSKLLQMTMTKFFTDSRFWENQKMFRINTEGNFDLSINGLHGMYNTYWQNQLDIDFSEVYVIKFRSFKLRDARRIFNICNRRFYCQQLKHEVVNGRLSDVIEGTFYPLD